MSTSAPRHLRAGTTLCVLLAGIIGSGGTLAGAQPAMIIPAGQIELARLIDLAAERLGIRVQYAPELTKGSVTLRVNSSAAMNALELWRLTNEELAARGATTVWNAPSGVFVVVKLENAAQLAGVTRIARAAELSDHPNDTPEPGFVSIQMSVQNRKAAAVAKALQAAAGKYPGSSVTQVGDTEVILISDLRERAQQLARLKDQLDAPADVKLTEYVPAGMPAPALVLQAKEVVKQRDAVSGEKTPGDVLALSGKQSVHIVAPADAQVFWRDLLLTLDKQGTLVETRTYAARSFAAKEVGRLVEQVCHDPAGTPGAAAVTPSPAAGASPAGSAADPWRLVVDELTGSLIITGTLPQHQRVAELIRRLDSVPAASAQRVRTYPVRNRAAKDVAESLQRLLEAGTIELAPEDLSGDVATRPPSPAEPPPPPPPPPSTPTPTPTPTRPTPGKAPPASTAPGGAPPRVKITVDEGTNALIAIGEPRALVQVEELLRALDRRQPQVMIELMLVSLSDTQTLALGVELDKLGSLAHGRVRLSSIFAPGVNAPLATPGAGFTGSYINDGDFSAVIRALETVNKGRSLSLPRVLVGNNQQAVFNSVAQQPTSTTSTNTTATTITSFGGFQDAGTKMTVKPQIADGDQLVLTYTIELSAFTGAGQNGLPSPRQQNSVGSVAMIPDGHTVVVGGLELTTDGQDVSQVPLLGALPLIGELFKTRANTNGRTRFFVFIRANIMRDSGFEDLKYVSARLGHEEGVGDVTEDAPRVEPRVIK